MVTFTASKGRIWTLNVNFAVVRQVEAELGFPLLDVLVGRASEKAETYRSFESVARRVWAAVTAECRKGNGVAAFEQFADTMYAEKPIQNLGLMIEAWEDAFTEFCGFDKIAEITPEGSDSGEAESPPPEAPGS